MLNGRVDRFTLPPAAGTIVTGPGAGVIGSLAGRWQVAVGAGGGRLSLVATRDDKIRACPHHRTGSSSRRCLKTCGLRSI